MDSRVSELQATVTGVTAQTTRNPNQTYLIWEMHKAQTGRIPVGPRMSAHRGGVSFKLLSLGSFANDSTKPRRGLTERE